MTDSPAAMVPVDLDRFVAQDYAKVVSAVRRICGPGVDAEDAVQDALVKLVRRGANETPIDSIAAWVTVVASNTARDGMRRRGAEERALRRHGAAADAMASESSTTDGRLDLDQALGALPDKQRTIATLFYVFDTPVATIATTMSISEGTVKTQLSRARAALAAAMNVQGGGHHE